MGVIVKIFGILRIDLGEKQIELEWKSGTLQDMILHLATRHGEAISQELFDVNGELDRAYAIFIKGERVDDLSTIIKDRDEVIITSMLAGGNEKSRRPKRC